MADQQDHNLDRIFAALSDPTRRRILSALLPGDRTVAEIAAPFAMSLAAVSKHIGLLIDAGLVSQRRDGRERWCRLEPGVLAAAFQWMQAFGYSQDQDDDELEAELVALGLIADET